MKKFALLLVFTMLMSCVPCISFANSDLPTNTKLAEWIIPSAAETFDDKSAVLNNQDESEYGLNMQSNGANYKHTLEPVSAATYSSKYYIKPTDARYGHYPVLNAGTLLTQLNDGFSVSAWVNYAGTFGQQTYFYITDADGNVKFRIAADGSTGDTHSLRYDRMTDDESGNKLYSRTIKSIKRKEWFHLAFSVGSSTSSVDDIKVWINGEEMSFTANGAATTTDGALLPIAFEETDSVGFAGTGTWTKASQLHLSDATIYSGKISNDGALALYESSKSDYSIAYDVKVMKDDALVEKEDLESTVEGNVWVEAVITDETDLTEENIYVIDKETEQKVPVTFTVEEDTVTLANPYDFWKAGEYQLVIESKGQTLDFSLTEDVKGREDAVSAVNAAIADPGEDFVNIETAIFTTYKKFFQISDADGGDYASVLNKSGIYTEFTQITEYESVPEIIEAFNSAIEIQKKNDFSDAVAALKEAVEDEDDAEFKKILLESYQPIFSLPVDEESVYGSLEEKYQDEVFDQLILTDIKDLSDDETVSVIRTEFSKICSEQKAVMEYDLFYAGLNDVAEEDIEATLAANIDLTNIPVDEELDEELYNDYQENKAAVNAKLADADISTNEKLVNEFYGALTLEIMNSLKTSDRAEAKRVLLAYGPYIEGMNKKLESKINTICTQITGDDFDDIDDLIDAIDDAVDGSDKGGGSVGGASTKPSTSSRPSKGSSGYTVNSNKTESTATDNSQNEVPENKPAETKGFTDLQGYEWAEEYINKLAESGVVNGKSENSFAPADNVTRFEYVTMLSRAYKMESEAELPFADVTDDHWAYQAVKGAYARGIIGGVDETTFDGDAFITREAMAVIVYRLMGGEPANAEGITEYADDAEISDWAVDAVYKMQELGVMGGKDGNMFDPKGLATRAETAAVISRLMECYAE